MSMDKDPGDYYRRKRYTADTCLDAISALAKLKVLELNYSDKYDEMIKFLEKRLEMARYVGD